jgi:drug/metabolite transporter (DMT)-like permease
MPTDRHQRLQVIVAFALVYVFWGSTYLAIGIADEEHLPPAVMCALRFLIAGPLMLMACAGLGRKVRISLNEALRLATIGCLLLVAANGGLAWAEQWVPTGLAALIVAVTPIWFMVLETFVFRGDRLSRRGLVGLALGIAGIAILFWPKFAERNTLGQMQLLGSFTLLFSSMSWAIGSVLSRKWQMKVDRLTATGSKPIALC